MPSRAEIKPKVIKKLAVIADVPISSVTESTRLWEDLDMGTTVRKALALPFSKIAKSYDGGIAIPQSGCADLKKAKDAINLVTKRARGQA